MSWLVKVLLHSLQMYFLPQASTLTCLKAQASASASLLHGVGGSLEGPAENIELPEGSPMASEGTT